MRPIDETVKLGAGAGEFMAGDLLFKTGSNYWYRNNPSDVFFNLLTINDKTPGMVAPIQAFISDASGGVHGGVPNVTGSQKTAFFVFCRQQAGVNAFTGVGSFIGYTAIIDSDGVDYNPSDPENTYRELAAFGGYATANHGGLVEGAEFRAIANGTAPTTMYGIVAQMVNNNTDNTQPSTGILLQSTGTQKIKKAMDINGTAAFDDGIDMTGAIFTNYAMKLPLLHGINFGGSTHTEIVSTNGTDLRFYCNGVYSWSFNAYGMRMPNDVNIIQSEGAPVDGTTGAAYAEKSSLCIDRTNANVYINAGTRAAPVWKLVTRAA